MFSPLKDELLSVPTQCPLGPCGLALAPRPDPAQGWKPLCSPCREARWGSQLSPWSRGGYSKGRGMGNPPGSPEEMSAKASLWKSLLPTQKAPPPRTRWPREPRGVLRASLREGALPTCGIPAGGPGAVFYPGTETRAPAPRGPQAPERSPLFLLFSGFAPCPGGSYARAPPQTPGTQAPRQGHPRPGPAPHWRSPPPVAAGRPGHRRLIRRGVLGPGSRTRRGRCAGARLATPESRPGRSVGEAEAAAGSEDTREGAGRREARAPQAQAPERPPRAGTGALALKAGLSAGPSEVPSARCARPRGTGLVRRLTWSAPAAAGGRTRPA